MVSVSIMGLQWLISIHAMGCGITERYSSISTKGKGRACGNDFIRFCGCGESAGHCTCYRNGADRVEDDLFDSGSLNAWHECFAFSLFAKPQGRTYRRSKNQFFLPVQSKITKNAGSCGNAWCGEGKSDLMDTAVVDGFVSIGFFQGEVLYLSDAACHLAWPSILSRLVQALQKQ